MIVTTVNLVRFMNRLSNDEEIGYSFALVSFPFEVNMTPSRGPEITRNINLRP